jgi:predicted TIM-barrel fold metal-dependent hydrolase
VIDTHLHLWNPAKFQYPWLAGIAELNREFTLQDYRHTVSEEITASLFVECAAGADSFFDEARWALDLASGPENRIAGVVAAVWPERPDFEENISRLAGHPKLKGIRRVLHTQPDELSQAPQFRGNIRRLGRFGFTFDLCVLQRQLGVALELVRACPGTMFVLDHCGVPDIAHNAAPHGEGFIAWRRAVIALAAEPNLHGKISGLTTYAAEGQRTEDGLRCYVDTMLESFGPERLVWGGDWPVVNLGSGLARWCTLTRKMLGGLSADEQANIFSANARVLYKLT